MIRVSSFNILNTSCRYEERRPEIQKAIALMQPDIIGLQEVNTSQIKDVESGFEIYQSLLPSPMLKESDPDFKIDGNCTLVNREACRVVNFSQLTYSSNKRIAQKINIRIGTLDIEFINTHLDHLSETERISQTNQLIEWLELNEENTRNIIVVGDFNFQPRTEPYRIMSRYFTSAVKAYAGVEPILTFPTGLYGENSDNEYYGCFDYIWVRGNIEVNKAGVLWEIGSHNLFASDHYPVYAELTVKK